MFGILTKKKVREIEAQYKKELEEKRCSVAGAERV